MHVSEDQKHVRFATPTPPSTPPSQEEPEQIADILSASQDAPVTWSWNMTLHVKMAIITSQDVRQGLSEPQIRSAATSPGRPRLRLQIENYPWTITVAKSILDYVAVQDVLVALYNNLHSSVSKPEMEEACARDGDLRAKVERTCRERTCWAEIEQKTEGVKRIDFLLGRHCFDGILPAAVSDGEWVVQTSVSGGTPQLQMSGSHAI